MMMWLGHALEAAAAVLFAWAWRQAGHGGPPARADLATAALYGWLLEALDMRIFGSYRYTGATWLWMGAVPLYIPLLWSLVLHSSIALSDRSGLPVWARPFLDGLLAVLIDLSVDAVAIRAGLWSWGLPLNAGWFGVPAGNLCAWMWVAAWYGGILRIVRGRIAAHGEPAWHRWLVPAVAYTGLLVSLMGIGVLGQALGLLAPAQRLGLFAGHVAGFAALVVAAWRRRAAAARPVPSSLLASRWLMHASFASLAAALGVWRAAPALLAASAAALLIERRAQRWCASAPA